jgi:hypothetical protein
VFRRFTHYSLALWLACGIAALPYNANADDNKEYLVKAAFIYNFVKFVEWPGAKAISQQSKIDICVLGETPLSNTGNVFAAASTAKLALSLVQENNLKNIASHCHVVFISRSENSKLGSVLAALKGQPVLLVSDMDDFANAGGMIGFVLDDNKIKIAVNKKAVTSSGMRVDAQLLEIAHEVIDK